jgi:Peptidase family S41
MKRTSGFLFIIVVLISSCVNYDVKEKDPATFIIPSYKAKEDFKLFRTIIEKAHPSLYSYLPKKRIETIFDSIATTIAQGITYRDFFNKLYFITNEIGCSHSAVSLPASVNDSLFNRALFFPLPVLKVENKLLVNYTGDRELPHGTEILKINNATAAAILDSLMFYNPVEGFKRETQQYMASADFGYEYFMKFGGNKKFTVIVKDSSGKKDTVILNALSYDDLSFRQQNKYYKDATDVDYSLVIDDTMKKATLRLTTFEFESINKQTAFDAFLKNSFELLKKRGDIKNLVIDLRENGGGFLYYCFLLNSYLSSVSFDEYKEVFSRLKFVPYEEYLSPRFGASDLDFVNGKLNEEFERIGNRVQHLKDTSLKTWEPDKLRFTGNIYIITNWHVNSAASYFTHLAKKTANAKVVGVETAGGTHSGNGFRTIKYQLPQTGFEFEFPFAKMIYTNGDKKTGRGMIPDYIIADTYESFIKNEDRQQVYINDSLLKKQ